MEDTKNTEKPKKLTNAIATDSKSTYIIRFKEKIYKFEFDAECTFHNVLECIEYLKEQVEITMKKNLLKETTENAQSTEQSNCTKKSDSCEEGQTIDEICEEIDKGD